jgi:hypothetical protein
LRACWDRLNSCRGYFRVMNLVFRVGDAKVEGKTLHVGILKLENAVFALFWEGAEPRLGSTTVTLPGTASSQLLGDRDQLLGRILGTHLAVKYGKLSLVSTHLSQGYSEEMGKTLLELVRHVMEERS